MPPEGAETGPSLFLIIKCDQYFKQAVYVFLYIAQPKGALAGPDLFLIKPAIRLLLIHQPTANIHPKSSTPNYRTQVTFDSPITSLPQNRNN
jgi:hypothetical protein